jgi:hypothetical protein
VRIETPLRHIYAFRIVPGVAATGSGEMVINAKLCSSLDSAYAVAKLDSAMPINLSVDNTTRTSQTRDHLLSIGFNTKAPAAVTATQMATRLALAMDQRSKPCLFVITVRGDAKGTDRQIVLWTFPQEEVFQFSSNLDVLNDVFSRSSFLRKAAVFEGKNNRAGFLAGRVLDFQLKGSHKVIADYWMGTFLEAQPQMSSSEGSRILGSVLRAAYDKVENDGARDQLIAAVVAVRSGPRTSWSIDQVIDSYLGDVAAEAVRVAAPSPAVRSGIFDVDRDSFMERLRFRAFDLEGGVRVIAPVEAVGQQVKVSDDDGGRQLSVEGHVEDERLRARL